MNTFTRLFTLLVLVASACGDVVSDEDTPIDAAESGELTADPAAPAPVNVPGTYRHRLLVAGQVRETLVYVPARARGAKTVPVVFMLHGTSGDGAKFYNISGWREKADAEGLIAVFPTALVHCFHEDENRDGDFADAGELKVTTKWNAGKLGDPALMPLCTAAELAALPPERRALADHPLADDMAFVTAMLDGLPRRYAVDVKRIYASGFSNGAQMTSRLALEMADRFAAIGANSGSLALDAHPAARPISVMYTVGELDDKLLAALGLAALPLDESLVSIPGMRAITADYLILAQLGESYSYRLVTVSGVQVATFAFRDSLVGAANHVQISVVEGLHHAYPNGKNSPIVMADVLWDFFKNESL